MGWAAPLHLRSNPQQGRSRITGLVVVGKGFPIRTTRHTTTAVHSKSASRAGHDSQFVSILHRVHQIFCEHESLGVDHRLIVEGGVVGDKSRFYPASKPRCRRWGALKKPVVGLNF